MGENRLLVSETDYRLFVTFRLQNIRNGTKTQVLALYGTASPLPPRLSSQALSWWGLATPQGAHSQAAHRPSSPGPARTLPPTWHQRPLSAAQTLPHGAKGPVKDLRPLPFCRQDGSQS